MCLKIISGGQTGVDRAALDVALAAGINCGGWCPDGRLAEDGVIAPHYPLIELAGARYRQRTRQNVVDSDATLIIYFSALSGGSELTRQFCQTLRKPYLLIDGEKLGSEQAAKMIRAFVDHHSTQILNVAGPRASHSARAYEYTVKTLQLFFQSGK